MDEDSPRVELVIPAETRYLRLVRLTAAGLAGDLGFSIDGIEDLRVSVDELCAVLIDGLDDTRSLTVSYRELGPGSLEISGHCNAGSQGVPELSGVARELLSILADDYSIDVSGAERTFRLRKHAG